MKSENVDAVIQENTKREPEEGSNNSSIMDKHGNCVQPERERQPENNTNKTPMMRKCRAQPAPPPQAVQDVNSAIEKLQKICDECRIVENEFDFFPKSLAVQLKKNACISRFIMPRKAPESHDR